MASMFNRTIGGYLHLPAKPTKADTAARDGSEVAAPPAGAGQEQENAMADSSQTVRQRKRMPVRPAQPAPPQVTIECPPTPAGPGSGAGAGAAAPSGSDAPGAQDSITLGQLKANGPPPVVKQKVRVTRRRDGYS